MNSKIMEMFDLSGKVAVVTGGSRGLGLQMGTALGRAGARVILVSRNADACIAAAGELAAEGIEAHGEAVDICHQAEVQSFADDVVKRYGSADILINSAGVQHRSPTVDFPEDKWRFVLDVNLTGPFFACQAFGRHMIAQGGGKIVNVGSLTSHIGLPGRVAYAASKGGVLLLTRTLAVEWAKHGVNVNAIGPGYFRTEMNTALFDNEEWVTNVMRYIPMKREGLPPDLEGTALYLCTRASDYMTGQILYVDGGFLAGAEV
ncbi:SDR family oxidoreductase [Fodinicurvata sp. EGI_FJ10296]|uniref:SDR family oxidoreductase n=1 Tax=Fodinicurvata sp. EGI_FJ10296 TaxID=3231908 RepID=UPI003452E947